MMLNFLLLALTIALIQLAGAYLRYLPFRGGLTPREGRRLWQLLFTWAVLSISLNTLLLSAYELNVPLYKAILFFGWLPYFLISLVAIKRPRTVHVFVLGMQCLWALTLHTAAAILESLLGFPEDLSSLSFVHAAFYLSLFALLLPAERAVFQSILPSPRLFATFFRWPMSLLPFIIFIGASLPLADSQLFHTWQYRIARLGLPLVFFFVYRAMSIATNQAERSGHNLQESIWMHQYIAVLREYNLLHESRNRELMALWQEMEDSYSHLERYLARGERKKALRYIEALEGRLDRTPLHLFAESPPDKRRPRHLRPPGRGAGHKSPGDSQSAQKPGYRRARAGPADLQPPGKRRNSRKAPAPGTPLPLPPPGSRGRRMPAGNHQPVR